MALDAKGQVSPEISQLQAVEDGGWLEITTSFADCQLAQSLLRFNLKLNWRRLNYARGDKSVEPEPVEQRLKTQLQLLRRNGRVLMPKRC